jgi:hypothetical protein
MKTIKQTLMCLLFFCFGLMARAQELFPNSEPASIIPKKTIGIRLMNDSYKTLVNTRTWHGAMFMYGVSSKFMLSAMITASNHHAKKLISDFVYYDSDTTHVHFAHEQFSFKKNSYALESINLGFRYRFLNIDGDHKHFRMAFFGNGSYSFLPHDEAEITLMGDGNAFGGGIISTVLIKRLAISLAGSTIKPLPYNDKATAITLNYGNSYTYNLSFGYLVYPFKYKNFKQLNINVYAEFIGKQYNALQVLQNNKNLVYENISTFKAGNYIELRPALQFIIKSNLRVDLSTSLPLYKKSYIRTYPLYVFNVQYYLFL